jgi:probable rRNA maturation factor
MSVVLPKSITSSAPSILSANRDKLPLPHKFDLSIQVLPGVDQEIGLTWIRDRLAAALQHMPDSAERCLIQRLSVLIVDDQRMAQLHRQYLGIDSTTDVLTFDSNEQGRIETDIAICADVAARRARELDHTVERELLLYAVHGLLHSVGFDDRDEASFAAMHAEEDRILGLIGVGATYGRVAPPDGGGT